MVSEQCSTTEMKENNDGIYLTLTEQDVRISVNQGSTSLTNRLILSQGPRTH